MTATKTRRKTSARDARKAENDARKAEVEILVKGINDEAPDFLAFMARWGDRYGENNLHRLWVQAPNATCLHKLPTWRGMGRKVKAGQKAIWLKQPYTSTDPDKITPENPNGEVFHGAAWMAMFDYAQTIALDEFEDSAEFPDADPGLVSEVKRLRLAAMKLHPDLTGDASQEASRAFSAAWDRYEKARDRLKTH